MTNRAVMIKFRATEEEREKLRKNAAKAGMSVSAYIRAVAINSSDLKVVTIDTEPLRELRNEVHKHGVNLNQMMRFLNTYGLDAFSETSVRPILKDERKTFLQIRGALQSLSDEARGQNVVIRLEPKPEIKEEDVSEHESSDAEDGEPVDEEVDAKSEYQAKHMSVSDD